MVLRESGLVNFHYANSRYDNRMKINLHSDFYINDGEKQFPSSEDKTITSQQPIIAVMSWRTGFNSNSQTTILTSVEERAQQLLGDDESINIKIESIELSGLYWIPLYKSGSCRYAFNVEIIGANTKTYRGDGNGEIDFSSFGTISINELKENISEQIASDLVSILKRETK